MSSVLFGDTDSSTEQIPQSASDYIAFFLLWEDVSRSPAACSPDGSLVDNRWWEQMRGEIGQVEWGWQTESGRRRPGVTLGGVGVFWLPR